MQCRGVLQPRGGQRAQWGCDEAPPLQVVHLRTAAHFPHHLAGGASSYGTCSELCDAPSDACAPDAWPGLRVAAGAEGSFTDKGHPARAASSRDSSASPTAAPVPAPVVSSARESVLWHTLHVSGLTTASPSTQTPPSAQGDL